MKKVLENLYRQLVVSCQAAPNDPMEDTATLRRVARSAVLGGARGLRLNSADDIRAIRLDTALPIIGIQKSYRQEQLRITPTFADAKALADAGADIVALDCTDRAHPYGEPWREIVARIQSELNVLIMADIATLREGIAAAAAGCDLIGTTLNGYTEETSGHCGFDPRLVADIARETGRPVVAEGHIGTPAEARWALDSGAWCVVVGSAITRPGTITSAFVRAIETQQVAMPAHAVGIDIGGTSIKSAIVSATGEVLAPISVKTRASGGRDVISSSLLEALTQTLATAKERSIRLAGIGIASAGAIDAKNGTVFAATANLPGWAGFDLRSFVHPHTDLAVFVENDAHAAALSELQFGAARGYKSFAALTIGTGIGGGIVLEGKLQRGQHGFAGTFGHQTIRFDGRLCNCGRRGCLEAYVSTAALIHKYRALSTQDFADADSAAQARRIAELSSKGDASAQAAYTSLAGYLAEGLANVFNILDPEAIFLSGGLVEDQPLFLDEVRAKTKALLHFGDKRSPQILIATAGHFAGVQGAASSVFSAQRL
jgi:N-acetylmannosamine-6-phosphate 2-epimerase/N-acetylmannosamine kinase